mgnify:CR=1 FL=1
MHCKWNASRNQYLVRLADVDQHQNRVEAEIHTQGPHVALLIIRFVLTYFRGQVIRCADLCLRVILSVAQRAGDACMQTCGQVLTHTNPA